MSQNTQNNLPTNTPYTGYLYAIPATGTLFYNQTLTPVTLTPTTLLGYVDVSGSLQLDLSASLLNGKFNPSTDSSGNLINNSITLTADEIYRNSAVASVGYMANIYTIYNNYVNTYFGNTTGFNLNFTFSPDPYSNGFTDSVLTSSNVSTLISDLSGSITVNNLTSLLRYSVAQNTFNNRSSGVTFTNGFFRGDLIYMNAGVNIVLNTAINNNGIGLTPILSSFYAIDSSFNSSITNNSNVLFQYAANPSPGNYTNTALKMSVTVPLLLRLV